MKEYDPNTIPLHIRGEDEDMMIPQTPEPEREPEPWIETEIVGKAMPRVDAYERVSGSAPYTYDIYLPGMLYTAILRSPYAHAKVKKIDVSKAKAMRGVHGVLSSADKEADVSFHRGRTKLFDTHLRHHGDEVAAVAAETPYLAEEALKLIEVEYEELAFALTQEEATANNAPVILADEKSDRGRTVGPNNTIKNGGGEFSRGDVEKGFAEADATVELDFHNDCVIHTPLEVHGSVAQWDGNKLKLWTSTQGVYNVLNGVSSMLKIPIKDMEVIGDYVGGGFGAKLSAWKNDVLATLLAKKTARPVKVMVTREASFQAVGNRPLTDGKLKGGVKKDGTISAINHTGSSTGGAFPYTNSTTFQSGELYLVENVKAEQSYYLSNAGIGCAMRAPGFPNGNFMTEQLIDQLAHEIKMDPVEFRLKNIPKYSQLDGNNRPYTSTGFAGCLSEGAKVFGWKEKRNKAKGDGPVKHGYGVAGGMWAYGGGWPPATIILKMYVDGSVSIITGASDIGTGTKTILTMIVAEELGMPVERVRIDNADTGHTPFASASGGSKTLPTEGPAARTAAFELKHKLLNMAAGLMKANAEELELKGEKVVAKANAEASMSTSEILQKSMQFDVVGVGYRAPNPEDKIIRTWGAHFADVTVNTHTGKVVIHTLLGANESGRVINKLTFNNQVYGGMTMAIGQGMSEQRVMDHGQTGKVINTSWLDYKVPTAKDVPFDQDVLAIEPVDTACNNLGAKGLGEPAMIPTMAAIANAIYNAIGVRITRTPITPVEVMKALAAKGQRG
jgi:CO/xanthine dehydrogenase Mo-binding subunit